MTRSRSSPEPDAGAGRPPLVLGLGNLLLGDDGVGLALLDALRRDAAWGERVEMLDGGTQGLALLGFISDRPAMVLLDAVCRDGQPGRVHTLTGDEALALRFERPSTAHEGGAGALLASARLTGDLPPWVRVVGVEPEVVRTGVGLSPRVTAALPEAVRRAHEAVEAMLEALDAGARPDAPAVHGARLA